MKTFADEIFSNQCLYNKAYVLVFAVTVQVGKSPDTVRRTANFLRLSGCMGFTRPSIPRFSRQNFCTPRICVFQAWNTDFAGICRFSASPSCMVHQHPLDLLQPVVYIRKNVAMKALQRNNEPNAIHIQEASEASGEAIMAKPNSPCNCASPAAWPSCWPSPFATWEKNKHDKFRNLVTLLSRKPTVSNTST